MKKCEVFVDVELEGMNIIKSKYNNKNTNFFTNDLALLEKGIDLELNIEMLATHFGFFTPEDDSINDISINRLNLLENYLSDGTLEGQSIVQGFRYTNLINLINLEKIRKILESKNEVIFIFKNFLFYFPAIIDLAKRMDFESRGKILSVLNSDIIVYNIDYRYNRLEDLKNRSKIDFEENDSFSFRLSRIKIKRQKFDIGFFLVNNDTDFYLKPIYPILKELNKNRLKVKNFTFDERTTNQILDQKLTSTNLSRYFFEAYFPFSSSIEKQMRYIIKEKTLKKFKTIQKTILKKSGIIPKFSILIVAIFELFGIHIKHWYILTKWNLLRYYLRNWEQNKIIKKILKKQKIKSFLLKDLTGVDEPVEFPLRGLPVIEIKKVLKFIDRAKSTETKDCIIENYLKYFNDNFIVGWVLKFLVTHCLVEFLIEKMQFKSLMVASDSTPFNNVVCNIANNKKIPTFSIPQVYIKFQKIATILPNASKIFVSGEKVKEEFIRLGMKKERIVVTGNPRYDYIRKNKESKRTEEKSKLIVVAMSRWHEKDPEWMSKLIHFCNKKSLDILLKIHPMYKFSTNNDFSERLIDQIKQNCSGLKFSISYDADLTQILPNTTILITEYSIVAVEAAFNEIPVISVNMNREIDDAYSKAYKNEGIAIQTSTISELFEGIEKILEEENTKSSMLQSIKKFNFNYNYLHDGKAAERIVEIISST